jgi:hypothetical protein
MKTPRELLFRRHEAVDPKLDALRHVVVARHCPSANQRIGFLARVWLELFHSCRHIWTGLAAVWLFLLLVNVTQRDHTPAGRATSASYAQVVIPIYTQEKLVNEMFADRGQPTEAVRPPKFEPKPRSETSGVKTL